MLGVQRNKQTWRLRLTRSVPASCICITGCVVNIVSLGTLYPNWQMKFLVWSIRQEARQLKKHA